MATIAFVSLYDRNAYGQRLMSASLKRHGHDCHIVFLKRYGTSKGQLQAGPDEHAWIGIDRRGRLYSHACHEPVGERELELLQQLIERIRPDLIGMTVNTPLRAQHMRVTRFLKSFSAAPVVWGGYDPTVNPEQCLEICDYACIGEGDTTILELAECIDRGLGFDQVRNLAYRRDGRPVFNARAPLVRDLDSLPWRDDEPENKSFIEDGRLEENYAVPNDRPAGSYQAMTARGCPYSCTYCCEASLKSLYPGERFLRRRSPDDCVSELAQAKARFDLHEIVFEDEIFGMDLKWLTAFAPLYRAKVDLPFIAYIYPTRNVETLLPLLKQAGLKFCCVALESGSARINRSVFQRVFDRELFLKTIRLCRKLRLYFYTDVITYNPYEEERDLEDTLDVLLDMGGRFELCVNKLFVLPGTRLAERMLRDGVTAGDRSRDRLFDYYCRLFWAATFSANARWAVRLLHWARVFRRHPRWLNLGFVEWLVSGPVGRLVDRMQWHLEDWGWLPKRIQLQTQADPDADP